MYNHVLSKHYTVVFFVGTLTLLEHSFIHFNCKLFHFIPNNSTSFQYFVVINIISGFFLGGDLFGSSCILCVFVVCFFFSFVLTFWILILELVFCLFFSLLNKNNFWTDFCSSLLQFFFDLFKFVDSLFWYVLHFCFNCVRNFRVVLFSCFKDSNV